MDDEGQCGCCGEEGELPYETRHGVQYCQACWDWGCPVDGDWCEYSGDPTRYQKRTYAEARNAGRPLARQESTSPTDQEVNEAIASIMREGGW